MDFIFEPMGFQLNLRHDRRRPSGMLGKLIDPRSESHMSITLCAEKGCGTCMHVVASTEGSPSHKGSQSKRNAG